MSELANERCEPCAGNVEPLPAAEIERLMKSIPGWDVTGQQQIERVWRLKDFRACLTALTRIAELAETQGHHPDLHVESYDRLRVAVWTHAANGLTRADFVLAAKIDREMA